MTSSSPWRCRDPCTNELQRHRNLYVGFLQNWPVNRLCGIVFNRFYRLEIPSLMVGIFDPACELLPPWTKELYLCTVAPLSSLWPPPPPPTKCTVYTDSVCLRGGGVELCCGPYSAGILHSVSDQILNLPNCFTTPNKMTSGDDIQGLVSLKFLRPCRDLNAWLPCMD